MEEVTVAPPTHMWVRMTNNVWWPAHSISEQRRDDFAHASARISFVSIVHLRIEVAVDAHDMESVRHVEADTAEFHYLCYSQVVPVHLRDKFEQCISALLSNLNATGASAAVPVALPASASKRLDVISWDDYFMAVAFLSSLRSKDPSTQVGACIVNADQRIVGIGYNGRCTRQSFLFHIPYFDMHFVGFPRGCSDDSLPWAREAADPLMTKYPVRVHVVHCTLRLCFNCSGNCLNLVRLSR